MQTIERVLYSYWASTLINNDYSGLNDAEIAELNKYIEDNPNLGYCIDVLDDNSFRFPDNGGVVGDCSTFIFEGKV